MSEDLEKVKSRSWYIIRWIVSLIERNKNLVAVILVSWFIISLVYVTIKQVNRTDELLKTVETQQSIGYIANYKNDMGFLDCIAEQHSCLFKNLKSNNYELTIRRCQNEDFCAIKYSSNK